MTISNIRTTIQNTDLRRGDLFEIIVKKDFLPPCIKENLVNNV
ncbi:protein of unknown function [Xenorhabdus poinarii G6]|uniref:Uncharacterized protein n=1 Tax=Xenorhabdus poinarii G6 TaxID=1354304 RepID=A0A068R703_9GAMM|nr:protein of unknown function [Xenorhabdus poinarii G6]